MYFRLNQMFSYIDIYIRYRNKCLYVLREIIFDRSLDNRGSALIFLCERDADKCIVYSHFDIFVTEKNGKEINQQTCGRVCFLSRRFFIRLYIFHWHIVDTQGSSFAGSSTDDTIRE